MKIFQRQRPLQGPRHAPLGRLGARTDAPNGAALPPARFARFPRRGKRHILAHRKLSEARNTPRLWQAVLMQKNAYAGREREKRPCGAFFKNGLFRRGEATASPAPYLGASPQPPSRVFPTHVGVFPTPRQGGFIRLRLPHTSGGVSLCGGSLLAPQLKKL